MFKSKAKGLFILLLIAVLVFTFGCKSDKDKSTTKSTAKQTTQAQQVQNTLNTNPLTGVKDLSNNAVGKRPVAIVVSNIPEARPQWGLCSPDIVVEGRVEGGITRMLWFYADSNKIPQKVGPIRSARHDFVEVAEGLDAIFIHWGGSEYAYKELKANSVNDIDGMKYANKYFARDTTRSNRGIEHRGYTTGEKINKAISDLSLRTDIKSSYANPFKFNTASSHKAYKSGTCNSVKFAFSSSYKHTFKYNSSDKLYYNNMNDKAMTEDGGKQMSVTNVIILYFPSFIILNSGGNIDMDLSGGKGIICSNGSYEEITWQKGGATSMLKLYGSDGTELKLNAGKSFIGLVPSAEKNQTVIS